MTGLQIEIQEKRFRDGERVVLRDLTFTVPSAKFVALVGPSGAGKSTLLNLIAGLDRDFRGTVQLDGVPTCDATARIGFVFQNPRLLPWLTARGNLRLVLAPTLARDRQVQAWLARVGLADWTDAFPVQLSGGMQRRLALARAFAIDPELILLDEPFVSLDAPGADRLRCQLLDLWQSSAATVIYVTHNLREALAMADRVLFLSSRPARVVLDYRVDLERPRALDSPELDTLYRQLTGRHPELLSGRTGSAP